MYKINDEVRRVASDYTCGRQGTVVDIDNVKNRIRVLWTKDRNGRSMKLRTWVKFSGAVLINKNQHPI